MAPSYYKLSNDLESKNVKFVDCPVTPKTAELHTALGITSIPFAHVYHPDVGLVEERKLSRARGNYSNFEKVVKTYVEQSCDVTEEGDYSSPWKEEVSSAAATNQL
jgi:hypothetical protein